MASALNPDERSLTKLSLATKCAVECHRFCPEAVVQPARRRP